jgi:hypothetical protein
MKPMLSHWRWLGLMGLLVGLMACTTAEPSPTLPPSTQGQTQAPAATEPTAELMATLPTGNYYLLDETPPTLIEVDGRTLQQVRTFPLTAVVGRNPEGIAFVPNSDVEQYGLYGLPPTANGGYFVISAQRDGTLHFFDVPLLNPQGGTPQERLVLEVPRLKEDASDLFYRAGELWVLSSSEKRIYHLALTATEGKADVVEEYKLKDLYDDFEDAEGFALGPDGEVYIGDDTGQTVYRFDNFPACMADENCPMAWSKYLAGYEPSGLYWDVEKGYLVVVDDNGRLFTLDNNTLAPTTLLTTRYDLEGITMFGTR